MFVWIIYLNNLAQLVSLLSVKILFYNKNLTTHPDNNAGKHVHLNDTVNYVWYIILWHGYAFFE